MGEEGEVRDEAEGAQGARGGPGVGAPLDGGGQRAPGGLPGETGAGPEQTEPEEGDEEGGEGSGEGVEGGDGQVVLGADAVGEEGASSPAGGSGVIGRGAG